MPPVRTKRRTLSRREIQSQQASTSRGRGRPRNQTRATEAAARRTTTSAAIVNVAAQNSPKDPSTSEEEKIIEADPIGELAHVPQTSEDHCEAYRLVPQISHNPIGVHLGGQ